MMNDSAFIIPHSAFPYGAAGTVIPLMYVLTPVPLVCTVVMIVYRIAVTSVITTAPTTTYSGPSLPRLLNSILLTSLPFSDSRQLRQNVEANREHQQDERRRHQRDDHRQGQIFPG